MTALRVITSGGSDTFLDPGTVQDFAARLCGSLLRHGDVGYDGGKHRENATFSAALRRLTQTTESTRTDWLRERDSNQNNPNRNLGRHRRSNPKARRTRPTGPYPLGPEFTATAVRECSFEEAL